MSKPLQGEIDLATIEGTKQGTELEEGKCYNFIRVTRYGYDGKEFVKEPKYVGKYISIKMPQGSRHQSDYAEVLFENNGKEVKMNVDVHPSTKEFFIETECQDDKKEGGRRRRRRGTKRIRRHRRRSTRKQ